jgi:hypothetical protein
MVTYDERVIAGLGPYHFSKTLLELATYVEIPPPVFYGKMEYIGAYVDWEHSVEIVMHGDIARICYKYHHHIPRTSAYCYLGDHIEDGNPIDHRG